MYWKKKKKQNYFGADIKEEYFKMQIYITTGNLKRHLSALATKRIYLYTEDWILFMAVFQTEYVITYNLLSQVYVPDIINVTAAIPFWQD